MKKLTILSIIILSFGNLSAQKNVIKVNLISPLSRTGSFFYERIIADRTTFQLGFYYTDFFIKSTSTKGSITTTNTTKFSGFGITPEFRFYSSEETFTGFYIAPFLRYQNLSITDNNNKATLATYGAGLLIGKQWLYRDRITLDLFVGPCLNVGDVEIESGSDVDFTYLFNGVGIRTGVTVGVLF